MTIQGAIYELNNMLSSNDIPCYWKPVIKKIIETVEQTEQNVGMCQQNVGEMSEKQTDGDLISRQAVIQALKENSVEMGGEEYCGFGVCYEEIESIVNGVPSAEKTTLRTEKTTITDGDLISREVVIEWLKGKDIIKLSSQEETARKELKELSSVESAEKTAEWVIHPKTIYAHLVCNKCLSNAPYDCKTRYCPNCGAKMKGVD